MFAVRRDREVVPSGARFAEDFAWGSERSSMRRVRSPLSPSAHRAGCCATSKATARLHPVMEFEDGPQVSELLR